MMILSRKLMMRYVRPLVLVFACVLFSDAAHSQIFFNNGANIRVMPSGLVMVNGSTNDNTGLIDNDGSFHTIRNFTIGAPATARGDGIYYVGGDWINNGTFTRDVSTVTLNGVDQWLRGTQVTTFNNLTILGGGRKTLWINERVAGVADFTNGIVWTREDSLLTFTTTGSWINGSNSSHVNGPCGKDMNSSTEFTFPIGKVGRFQRSGIWPAASTATTYRSEYFFQSYWNTTSMAPPLQVISKIHYWHMDRMTTGGANARVRLYWIPGDYNLPGYMADLTALTVARWDSTTGMPVGQWVDAGVTQVNGNYMQGNILSNTVSVFITNHPYVRQPFTIASLTMDNALPVELAFFLAKKESEKVKLTWKTNAEIQNLGFEIERAPENGYSELIGTWRDDEALRAKSSRGAEYETYDIPPQPGTYKYSLYQRDMNGTRTYAASYTLNVGPDASDAGLAISIYPNPVATTGQIQVQLGEASEVELKIFDMTGRAYGEGFRDYLPAGSSVVKFDASNLPAGSYVVALSAGIHRETRTFLVLK